MTKRSEWPSLIYKHAIANYEKGGWDYIVECWTTAEIGELVEPCASYDEALAKVASVCSHLDERRSELRGEAW
jgi:hypothetical protein